MLIWNRENTPVELHPLLETLSGEYPIAESGDGIALEFHPVGDDTLRVVNHGGKTEIMYPSRSAAARGVAMAMSQLDVEEKISFSTMGVMMDCSRNAVMTVEYVKHWLRRLALLGYNTAQLYTEDTFQLPGHPEFGYLRGGYSLEELREIDDYAARLGIEMVPCIQTLGHMEQILKWNRDVRDTNECLLVDAEPTYELIDGLFAFWSRAFRSRRINVGMDECWSLGLGNFLRKNGYEPEFDLFNRHLARVVASARKYGYARPMIWSDMYFRLASPDFNYYDKNAVVPPEVVGKIPQEVDLVYWDYYHYCEEDYLDGIARHRRLGREPVMASCIRTTWTLWYDHQKTLATAAPCVDACRKAGIKTFFYTIWGDDGAFCEFDSALAGLAYGADLLYGCNGAPARMEILFRTVCGGSYRMNLEPAGVQIWLKPPLLKPSELPWDKIGPDEIQSAHMLWDDPLLGIGWRLEEKRHPGCWQTALLQLRKIRDRISMHRNDRAAGDIDYAWHMVHLLIRKIEFRQALLDAYERQDSNTLKTLAIQAGSEIPEVIEDFSGAFRRQWMRRNKPFGMESMQLRVAGLAERYRETARRIEEYLSGMNDRLQVLEEKNAFPPQGPHYRYYATSGIM